MAGNVLTSSSCSKRGTHLTPETTGLLAYWVSCINWLLLSSPRTSGGWLRSTSSTMSHRLVDWRTAVLRTISSTLLPSLGGKLVVTTPPPRVSTPDPFGDVDCMVGDYEPIPTSPEPLPPPMPNLAQVQRDPDLNPNPNPTPNPHHDFKGGAYHLYIDFNKAFNSVPRWAIFKALRRCGLP